MDFRKFMIPLGNNYHSETNLRLKHVGRISRLNSKKSMRENSCNKNSGSAGAKNVVIITGVENQKR